MATYQQSFDPKGANLFSSAIPTLVLANGTNIPVSGVAFNDTTLNAIFVELKALAYSSGNVTVKLVWYGASTTNNVVWGAQIAAITPGDAQSLLTDSLATASTTTTAASGTTNAPTETTVTVTNLDSLAAGDVVQLRIYRDAASGSDTFSGDAILVDIEVSYAATGGTGAGDVTGPGSATDNAITRFDSTTGKVIQNSSASVDDSGNLTATSFIGIGASVGAEIGSGDSSIVGTSLGANLSVSLPVAGTYLITVSGIISRLTGTSTISIGLTCNNLTRHTWQGYIGANASTAVVSGASFGTTTISAQLTTASVATAGSWQAYYTACVVVSAAATFSLQGARSTGTASIRAGSGIVATRIA